MGFYSCVVLTCPPLTETNNWSCLGARAARGGVAGRRWRGGGAAERTGAAGQPAWGRQESEAGSRSPQPASWLQFWPLVPSPFCITSPPFSRPHGLVEVLVSAGSQIFPQFLHRLALWVPGLLSVGSWSSWSLPWERRGSGWWTEGWGATGLGPKQLAGWWTNSWKTFHSSLVANHRVFCDWN